MPRRLTDRLLLRLFLFVVGLNGSEFTFDSTPALYNVFNTVSAMSLLRPYQAKLRRKWISFRVGPFSGGNPAFLRGSPDWDDMSTIHRQTHSCLGMADTFMAGIFSTNVSAESEFQVVTGRPTSIDLRFGLASPHEPIREETVNVLSHSLSATGSSPENIPVPIRNETTTTLSPSAVSTDDSSTMTHIAANPGFQPLQANQTKLKTITVRTYIDSTTQLVWKALNTSPRKFQAFLSYHNVTVIDPTSIETQSIIVNQNHPYDGSANSTNQLPHPSQDAGSLNMPYQPSPVDLRTLRQEWRKLWRSGQLLTDRTEWLATYPSDTDESSISQSASYPADKGQAPRRRKRGGFADLLHLYVERLVSILCDEEQQQLPSSVGSAIHTGAPTAEADTQRGSLVNWLEENYGYEDTSSLKPAKLQQLAEEDQLGRLKHFLEWFRSRFPYYYDRCQECGASVREDSHRLGKNPTIEVDPDDNRAVVKSEDISVDTLVALGREAGVEADLVEAEDHNNDPNEDEGDAEESDHKSFLGYIYPHSRELEGKASRTELYQCHICKSFTRFPRFNSVSHVIADGRGRCGEYSMLLFRFLRALGHDCRWVVDWADHVWAEIWLTPGTRMGSTPFPLLGNTTQSPSIGRWVHLDPCEAAVDENLIYQGWGKKQTYIVGFYAPALNYILRSRIEAPKSSSCLQFPLMEDITQSYTSDSWEEINKRRDEPSEEITIAMEHGIRLLERKLLGRNESASPNGLTPASLSSSR